MCVCDVVSGDFEFVLEHLEKSIVSRAVLQFALLYKSVVYIYIYITKKYEYKIRRILKREREREN